MEVGIKNRRIRTYFLWGSVLLLLIVMGPVPSTTAEDAMEAAHTQDIHRAGPTFRHHGVVREYDLHAIYDQHTNLSLC